MPWDWFIGVKMLYEPHYLNTGPFVIERFEGFLFAESFRKLPLYLESWQHDWRIIWFRSRDKSVTNIEKLSELKISSNSLHTSQFSHRYDAKQENSILSSEIMDELRSESNSFSNIGEFMHYAKTRSNEIEMQNRDIIGLKSLMNFVVDNKSRQLYLTQPLTSPDLEDPLQLFDNPLCRFDDVDNNDVKLPKIHVGQSGVILPFQSEVHNLASINICHAGCKSWIIIHPSSAQEFVRRVAHCVYLDGVPPEAFDCFVRNKKYAVTLQQLDLWRVHYTLIFQEEGDVVITLPGVIHASCNLTFCISSSMNFLTLVREDAEIIQESYQKCMCHERHGTWINDIPSKSNQMIWEWMYYELITKSQNHPNTSSNISSKSHGNPMHKNVSIQELEDPNCTTSPLNSMSSCPSNYFSGDKIPGHCHNTAWTKWSSKLCSIGDDLCERSDLQQEYQKICAEIQEFCIQVDNFAVKRSEPDMVEIEPAIHLTEIGQMSSAQNSVRNNNNDTVVFKSSQHEPFPISEENATPRHEEIVTIETAEISPLAIKHELRPHEIYQNQNLKPETTAKQISMQRLTKYNCPQCSRQLSSKAHLQRHMYLKHSPEDISVQCPICLKMYN
ncbi:uncharacterized protein LOC110844843 isoform X2 [Folsomia candida]|uniref:uncharacterized protein LOC110844843 isoform X2 n=1 Tax=Folsomia candida TaxID=158441 RepID=UPI0016052C91|nr:uncharacterized protein LOC110844843 isoform X2 [Folsomia candida]